MNHIFQPHDSLWNNHAKLAGLRSVLDPNNQDNRKNTYINYLHRHIISSIRPSVVDKCVLDFGCGSGRFSKILSADAGKVIAVDITLEMLSRAAKEIKAENVSYITIDGINLPLKNGAVDNILSVWVLQYAARNQDIYRSIMREFKRVLKPGGSIFILEQVSFAPEEHMRPECTLRIKDYLGEMEKYFYIKNAYPVRGAGRRSFLQRLAVK